MGIELYWDNDEQTVMLCEIEGAWTWDDLYDVLNRVKKVTDKAQHEIAAIVHVSGGVKIPGGSIFTPAAFDHAKRMVKMGEGGTGPVVIVGASPVIKTAYETFRTIDRRATGNIHFAASVDEARQILTRIHNPGRPIYVGHTSPVTA